MSGLHDAAVRNLCRQITQENDPQKVDQLLAALRTVLKEGQEEARLRMGQIARHYPPHISSSKADKTRTEHPRPRGLRGLIETGLGISFGRNFDRSEL